MMSLQDKGSGLSFLVLAPVLSRQCPGSDSFSCIFRPFEAKDCQKKAAGLTLMTSGPDEILELAQLGRAVTARKEQ